MSFSSRAKILAALSMALDLVEGQPEGHAIRTAAVSLKIGEIFQLRDDQQLNLLYASLLKDSGCSNNSVRLQKIFGGDEVLLKRNVKFIDWTSTTENVRFAFAHTEPGKSLITKLKRLSQNLAPPSAIMNEVTEARCTRGAMIAGKLGFDFEVAHAIQSLDEHWDGKGSPYGIKRDEIPLLGRIICLAQTFEVFFVTFGLESAFEMLNHRSKKWFDPDLVLALKQVKSDSKFWDYLGSVTYESLVSEASLSQAAEVDIDGICEAFALIIDAKSSFTAEHSTRVAQYAVAIGKGLGLNSVQLRELKRAGLLHDIGKLAVSSSILEKPGKLTDEEFSIIRSHPKHSFEILRRIEGFETISQIASAHHERLDGRGYWQGLAENDLTLEMRIMAVADVYDALSAKRPYRDALCLNQCYEIMQKDSGSAFDPECLNALWTHLSNHEKMVA